MTTSDSAAVLDHDALAERFRPLFDRIAEGALEREKTRTVSREQFDLLRHAGFGRIRIPVEHGGLGGRLSDVFLLTAELAAIDPNLAHVWRSQYAFVEDRISAPEDPFSATILRRLASGEVVGGGWSERSGASVGTTHTVLEPAQDGGWFVTGDKYYSTGSIYADWITVLAGRPDGELVVALVGVHQDGVEVRDDWDGFGQQVTGSGSVLYRRAHLPAEHAIPYGERFRYQAHYYQTFLNAVVVGIGRAVLRDGVAALRARGRAHPGNVSSIAREDPQLLQVVGEVAALVRSADATFAESVRQVDRAAEDDAGAGVLDAAWDAVVVAQLVVTTNVLAATTQVLDALGSSGTSTSLALDRHWRNARTIASHNPRVARARDLGDGIVNGRSAPVPSADERSVA
ncbi:acyl-CoA dehydrogenase family protein [Curtobacterium sp. BRB10]|uniref:acyl-CoA dehydrogenase family protein n=1 Tax=Curtobacterium sp. BRB10 TaxID=2962579 RepID=UPI0028824348|nr:acyl-CoA dehydrogenase family protein [Curtobacterium sp. BRB10]MDT0234805.1 monooxygenase [Curtobacterium sp. BRB10]